VSPCGIPYPSRIFEILYDSFMNVGEAFVLFKFRSEWGPKISNVVFPLETGWNRNLEPLIQLF
jgi:hypothetical protein